MRRRLELCVLVLTFAAVFGCGGGDGSGGGAGTTAESAATLQSAIKSTNFSGYQRAGGLLGFKKVSGSWTVPSVPSSSTDTASSIWAGIGGGCTNPPDCTLVEPTLIQAGTEQDSVGGQPTYFAWWEALPGPAVPASGGLLPSGTFDVLPGDRITVDVDGSDLAVWMIRITDVRGGTTHWTFNTTVPYLAAGTTVEWIVESPLAFGVGSVGQPTLSNFGRVSLFGLTENGMNPDLESDGDAFVLTDGQGKVLASPSVPASSGDAFDVCFGSGACS